MDIRKLQRAIVDGLEEVKGQNIVVFNTEHLSPLFERVIIASGTSNRQTRALAASVRDAVKSKGFGASRTEGEDNGEWIIVDCGAAVVHLMQPGIRDYYHLEEIWGGKPVRLKLDGAPRGLVKAADPAAPASASRPMRPTPATAAPAAAGTARAKKSAPAQAPSAAAGAARRPAAPAAARSQAGAAAPAQRTAARRAVTRVAGVKRSAADGGLAQTPAPTKPRVARSRAKLPLTPAARPAPRPAAKAAAKSAAKHAGSAAKTARRKA